MSHPLRNWTTILTILLLTAPAGFPAIAGAQELPDAENIISRFIEATGGTAAYEKKINQVSKGRVVIEGAGMEGRVQIWESVPRNLFVHVDIAGVGTIEEGTQGDIAWERSIMQGPRIKKGEERAVALRNATFSGLLRWRELYKTAEAQGEEDVEGRPCYKVVLTPDEGKPVSYYFEKETGYLRKIAGRYATQMGEIPSESIFDDYREVGGILLPHRMAQKVLTMTLRFEFDDIRFNEELPADRFALPPDVKALVTAEKTP